MRKLLIISLIFSAQILRAQNHISIEKYRRAVVDYSHALRIAQATTLAADEQAALGFGVDEFLCDDEAWTLLEWPVRIEKILPPEVITLTIEPLDDETRQIRLEIPEKMDK